MNNVEPRVVKGNLVDIAKFREWKERRQKKVIQIRKGKAVDTFASPVIDRRRKTCWNCRTVLEENEKICPNCNRFVAGDFSP
ncbi:MAG: hypothetical protein V1845_01425 [bacterium]